MSASLAEFVGTMILVLLGNGVVANVVLSQSKGEGGGWIVITTGWAFAVAVAVYCVGAISGAHLNPAITLGLAAIGRFGWADVPAYVLAQLAGAFVGAMLVWIAYRPHWTITKDPAAKRAVFCTAPAVRHPVSNVLTEIIGTAVLMLGVLAILRPANLDPKTGFSAGLGPLLVGVLVWSIGLSLGGPTGYAINPARDLGPRLAHALLPIAGKGDSDWTYAWVPVVGPVCGGLVGAWLYTALWGTA